MGLTDWHAQVFFCKKWDKTFHSPLRYPKARINNIIFQMWRRACMSDTLPFLSLKSIRWPNKRYCLFLQTSLCKMWHTKSLVSWECLGHVSLFSVMEVLFSPGFSAVPCCSECWNYQGYTRPAMCFSLFSASSTALYSPQSGGQHRIFSGWGWRSFPHFLFFLSL